MSTARRTRQFATWWRRTSGRSFNDASAPRRVTGGNAPAPRLGWQGPCPRCLAARELAEAANAVPDGPAVSAVDRTRLESVWERDTGSASVLLPKGLGDAHRARLHSVDDFLRADIGLVPPAVDVLQDEDAEPVRLDDEELSIEAVIEAHLPLAR